MLKYFTNIKCKMLDDNLISILLKNLATVKLIYSTLRVFN